MSHALHGLWKHCCICNIRVAYLTAWLSVSSHSLSVIFLWWAVTALPRRNKISFYLLTVMMGSFIWTCKNKTKDKTRSFPWTAVSIEKLVKNCICVFWQVILYLCFGRVFGINKARPLVFPGAFAVFCRGREEWVHAAVLCMTGNSTLLPRGSGIAGEGSVCSKALAPALPQSLGANWGSWHTFQKLISSLSSMSLAIIIPRVLVETTHHTLAPAVLYFCSSSS